MKRTLAIVVLFAFVLMGALPCQAAFMSCGMKMPVRAERCASCAPAAPTGTVLKAGPCCRAEAGQDRSSAPAVISGPSPGSSAPVKAALATLSAPVAASTDATGSLAPAASGTSGPPLSSPHTTVLRL